MFLQNLGPVGSAVLTFIGYKQTSKQKDRQAKFIYRYTLVERSFKFRKTMLKRRRKIELKRTASVISPCKDDNAQITTVPVKPCDELDINDCVFFKTVHFYFWILCKSDLRIFGLQEIMKKFTYSNTFSGKKQRYLPHY